MGNGDVSKIDSVEKITGRFIFSGCMNGLDNLLPSGIPGCEQVLE